MGGLGSNIIAILPIIRIASYHHTIIPRRIPSRVFTSNCDVFYSCALSLFVYRRCGIFVGSKASHRLSRRSVDLIVHYGV
jgi:hypothetical protein